MTWPGIEPAPKADTQPLHDEDLFSRETNLTIVISPANRDLPTHLCYRIWLESVFHKLPQTFYILLAKSAEQDKNAQLGLLYLHWLQKS